MQIKFLIIIIIIIIIIWISLLYNTLYFEETRAGTIFWSKKIWNIKALK